MWGPLGTLLFLHLGRLVHASCDPNVTATSGPRIANLLQSQPGCLNFSGRAVSLPNNASVGDKVEELDLSGTELHNLPQEFLASAKGLKVLHLQDNQLKELPPQSFEKSPRLKQLKLENNALRSVPVGNLHHCLDTLSVDCSCNVTGSIDFYCRNCTDTTCSCASSKGSLKTTDFYAQSCRGPSPGLYATAVVVPIVALLLIAGLAYFLVRKKQGATISPDKRASNASDGARGQPRYICHAGPQGDADRGAMGDHADYANIFIDQPQEAAGRQDGKQQPKKSWPPGTPQGEQPIYANTQDLYYNYDGPAGTAPAVQDEELYIIPDK